MLSETVSRNLDGQITTRTETDGSGATSTYGYVYDTMGRLKTVTLNGATVETYGYDSTGALIARGNGLLGTYTTTDGYGRPTSVSDGTTASWSPDGELTSFSRPSVGSETLSYDGLGRLTQVTLPNGQSGEYRYDGFGRRVSVRLAGQLTRRFVYGGGLFPLARVDASGSVIERYIYGSHDQVPDLIDRRDGVKLRLVTDSTGSVRAVVDIATGQVMERLSYDAYGRVTQDTDPGLQPFGYKGSISDPVAAAAGLDWMGARAYTPTLGRFITPDPEGISAAWNETDALGGDPINLYDPDGSLAEIVPEAADGYEAEGAAQRVGQDAVESQDAEADQAEKLDGDDDPDDCEPGCCNSASSGLAAGVASAEAGGIEGAEGAAEQGTSEATQLHHADPKFMGGEDDQPLTEMRAAEHRALHRDLNDYLREHEDEFGNHMRPQRGNSGRLIRANFTRAERLRVMARFYLGPGAKYTDAAESFFSQHPELAP